MINWIASYPKSGNTWTRLFLQAYIAGDEFDPNKRLETFLQDIDRRFYAHLSPIDPAKLTGGEKTLMRCTALLRMAHAGERIQVKTHCANRMLDWVPLIPPAVTRSAVYIVRDPRDVAISSADHCGVSIGDMIRTMADENHGITPKGESYRYQFVSSWSEHVKSWADEPDIPVTVIRYEDMQSKPKETFTKVLDAFGYDIDSKRIDKAIEATRFDRLKAHEEQHGFNNRSEHQERFFRNGKAAAWKETLTDLQADQIIRDHRETMERFNYA